MQNREFNRPDPAGTLSISEDVIATIAANTTTEIEGVAALANFYSNVVSSWFWKKQSSRPIIINLNDDVATIDIHVSLRSGVRTWPRTSSAR